MIKISKHAKDRALERFGIKEEKVDEKINSFLKNAVEIFCNGQGRAFENKQHGIVIITDIAKSNVVTVYHSKGNEISIQDKDCLIEKNEFGLLEDKYMRNLILIGLEKRLLEFYKKEFDLELKINYNSSKIVKMNKSLIKIKEKHDFELKVEEIKKYKNFNIDLNKDRKILQKQKNKLVNDVSEIIGFDLNSITDIISLTNNKFRGE